MRRQNFALLLFLLLFINVSKACAQFNLAEPSQPLAFEPSDAAASQPENSEPAAGTPAVTTSIRVSADAPDMLQALVPDSHITQQELLSAAGTFGDFTRYFQVLPGVVRNSDLSNEVLVRGGHPTENLFVVDGIEIPNINHFSLSGSNGGFTSMLDASAIGSIDMRPGVYDASYSSRLSSLVDIHTRQLGETEREGELTVGISGIGGLYQRELGPRAAMLFSAHRSIVNLLSSDIGINGVPTYSNALTTLQWSPNQRDSFTLLGLGGNDSIDMNPCAGDMLASSLIQTQYSGWRSTEGMEWSHVYTPQLVSKLSASTTISRQRIGQQLQIAGASTTCKPAGLEPVYRENSRDGLSVLSYQIHHDHHGLLLSAGATAKLSSINDQVMQPGGEQSTFSTNPVATDAIQMSRHFNAGQTAAFVEAEGSIGERWKFLAGLRAETFAIDGAHAFDPRASLAYKLNRYQTLHASWGLSSQLPPTMDLLSYSENHHLQPVEVNQSAAGMRVVQAHWGTIDAEAYQKHYRNEAVSTEYPQLALNNMIDTLGQQFVWLPLTSAGTADSRGVELTVRAQAFSRVRILGSATYSRTTYRALDGVRRLGNYDVPIVANVMATVRLGRGWEFDLRDSVSSGRLYTPYNLAASFDQNRAIYDLTQINARRGPIYNRLDPELAKVMRLGKGSLDIHAGAENILDRHNFLGYVWEPNCEQSTVCSANGGSITRVPQMGLYPAIAAHYRF